MAAPLQVHGEPLQLVSQSIATSYQKTAYGVRCAHNLHPLIKSPSIQSKISQCLYTLLYFAQAIPPQASCAAAQIHSLKIIKCQNMASWRWLFCATHLLRST